MMRPVLFATLLLGLAACDGLRRESQSFDGQFFRANASKVDGNRQQIEVTVRPASASIEGAQEAGRFEATKYCIENYGSSVVIWAIGPDDDPSSYTIANDTLVLRGTCEG